MTSRNERPNAVSGPAKRPTPTRPLDGFYLIYNDTRAAGRPDQRTFAIKRTLMLAF